jgi:hypothetical protein
MQWKMSAPLLPHRPFPMDSRQLRVLSIGNVRCEICRSWLPILLAVPDFEPPDNSFSGKVRHPKCVTVPGNVESRSGAAV